MKKYITTAEYQSREYFHLISTGWQLIALEREKLATLKLVI